MAALQSFVLASGSPSRAKILNELCFEGFDISPQDIDESELKNEPPRTYIKRICSAKVASAKKNHPDRVILAADTIVAVGRRILQKAQSPDQQHQFMSLISGRRHYSMTAVGIYNPKQPEKIIIKLVETLVQMKRMTDQEIAAYVDSGVWQGCSGYKFDYMFQSLVKRIDGSVSSIQGLPVYTVRNLLGSAGVFPKFSLSK
ncbi:MAG: septum formation protein Maf [Verrucomicrobiales bacterium]|nr:septum formation protein Maf [Verrucomicrobiales bacterium]|tara:strand:- start:20825 stop:21427 length:603 start_codon:yes stop_codon:yes gene_type:complete